MSIRTVAAKLSRAEKAQVCHDLHHNLTERQNAGPAEAALDAFIPWLLAMGQRLGEHVSGKAAATAMRAASSDRVDETDAGVDTWGRHVQSFLWVASLRRRGEHAPAAKKLHDAAFPQGLAFIDAHVPQENAAIRTSLTILRAPENQATLEGIRFPMEWLDQLEAAVNESDAAYGHRVTARSRALEHVARGRDAEEEWLDLVTRLVKTTELRAPVGDMAKEAENAVLLAPLNDAMAHAKTLAAARATRRKKARAGAEAPATGG